MEPFCTKELKLVTFQIFVFLKCSIANVQVFLLYFTYDEGGVGSFSP